MIHNSVASLFFWGQICSFWPFLNSFGFCNFWKKAKWKLAFLDFIDQFNFYVDLADLKMVLSDFETLADICILFLDTEW